MPIAFSRFATEAVDVCALRTALLALPDLRAAALDLAFSVDTAGSGLDESVPRLLAEAAAAGSAPAPGTAYVVRCARSCWTRRPTAGAQDAGGPRRGDVAAVLDGASDAYDKAQAAVQDTRDAWVNGEDCGCEPEGYGRGECPCGTGTAAGIVATNARSSATAPTRRTPTSTRTSSPRTCSTRSTTASRAARPCPGRAGGGARRHGAGPGPGPRARVLAPRRPADGAPGPPREMKVTAFGRTLHARIDERLDDMLDNAISAATEEGRPELLARLLPLQPAAPFPAGAVETAMTRRPESRRCSSGPSRRRPLRCVRA